MSGKDDRFKSVMSGLRDSIDNLEIHILERVVMESDLEKMANGKILAFEDPKDKVIELKMRDLVSIKGWSTGRQGNVIVSVKRAHTESGIEYDNVILMTPDNYGKFRTNVLNGQMEDIKGTDFSERDFDGELEERV